MSVIYPGLYSGANTKILQQLSDINPIFYSVIVDGKYSTLDELKNDAPLIFTLRFKLLGGKGGFGSLLKSFRINKSSNQLMCRDLSGRRLADVKEEERLRKWIGKKEERDKAEKRKDEEKLEKLRSGHKIKYHFKDKKYMRQRDVVLESVEDAIEAGVAEESPESGFGESSKSISPVNEEDATSDSDMELEGGLLLGGKNRKRKNINHAATVVEEKKIKMEETIVNKKDSGKPVAAKIKIVETKTIKVAEKKPEQAVKVVTVMNFDPIDIDAISDVKELEAFGLDHLKHALESRGLKCGGSLSERASRLFSIKNLAPEQYPKKILAAKK